MATKQQMVKKIVDILKAEGYHYTQKMLQIAFPGRNPDLYGVYCHISPGHTYTARIAIERRLVACGTTYKKAKTAKIDPKSVANTGTPTKEELWLATQLARKRPCRRCPSCQTVEHSIGASQCPNCDTPYPK